MQENRLAVVSIIVGNREVIPQVNALLTEFGEFVLGRMGIPYKEKGVNIISIALDAPTEVINKLTGKLGMLSGVTAKTLMHKA